MVGGDEIDGFEDDMRGAVTIRGFELIARYNTGLVMFGLPILFGWVTLYVAEWIPNLEDNSFAYAIGGDMLLLASLFVLGGDSWDKIRALFVYSDKVCSSTTQRLE